jgi:delta8-fatty-acid desaturase
VFDLLGGFNAAARRKRRRKSGDDDDSSISSLSSLDLGAPPNTDELSRINTCTRKEIDLDLDKYPSLDLDTQSHIIQKYRALNDRIRAEGLYNCNYHAYALELCRYTFLFTSMLHLLHYGQYTLSGLCLGMFWHQLVFTAHDAGHMGITHSFTLDTVIGILIADFLGGLSLGWWKRNHNVHHIVTNAPEHDPDIEHMPFFAISHRFLASLRSSYYDRIMPYDTFARLAIPWQKYLYYPLLTLGRFNLYRLTWEYLLLGQAPRRGPAWWHRYLELAGQAFFWSWFGYGILYRSIPTLPGRLAFILASHMITVPLHVQITLSHFAMSTADLGVDESFPQKMLRTTMDVECPPWLDFFHGGLQFQAVHHLYPRIPRHNLRRTQDLVRGLCEEVGIPYALFGFVDGNREVLGRLGEVGRQARILGACQKVVAEGRMGHGHGHY